TADGLLSSAGQAGGTALLATLERLDVLRDGAFESGNAAVLRQVYAPGSAPLHGDLRMLRSMVSAGERATGLRLAIRRLAIVSAGSASAEVRVTDELGPYQLVSADGTGRRVAGR